MRIAVSALFRLRDRHAVQHVDGLLHGFALAHALMHADRLSDLMTYGKQWVQGGHRFLEDHGDLVAADLLHLPLIEVQQIAALEADGTADNAARRIGDEPQDGQRTYALAAA